MLSREAADIGIAHDGQRLQPVFALLRCSLPGLLLCYLHEGERKVEPWYRQHPHVLCDFSDTPEALHQRQHARGHHRRGGPNARGRDMLNPEAPPPRPSCADEHDPDALPVEEALARIHADIAIIPGCERVALRGALGRVLARDVRSPLPVPGHANAAMDGYALQGADLPSVGTRELEVLGAAFAGRPFEGVVGTGQCVRIMTGAVVPEGVDTVLMQERVELLGKGTIRIGPGRAGDNVRPAGEDLAPGRWRSRPAGASPRPISASWPRSG